MGCSAWPFLVGGATSLVNFVSERSFGHRREDGRHVFFNALSAHMGLYVSNARKFES